MASKRIFAALGALAMAAVAACAGDSTPVAPTVQDGPVTSVTSADPGFLAAGADPAPIGEATSVLRTRPLDRDLSVTQVIGPSGGLLEIPAAGLRVMVPRGALARPTAITATALKGDMVAYQFGPHGTRFAVPLLVTQDIRGTDLAALPPVAVVQAGYFTRPTMLDQTRKKARLAEVLPTYGLKVGDNVGFLVWHFSGYILHWDFKGDDDGGGNDGRE